jgi:hypothetical protein
MQFAQAGDLGDLSGRNNAVRKAWMEKLHYAVFGDSGNSSTRRFFSRAAAKPKSIERTQKELLRAIRDPRGDRRGVSFNLAKQELVLKHSDNIGYYYYFVSEDLPTMVCHMFCYLLRAALITRNNFRRCGDPKCENVAIPIRKPRADQTPFCSPKCRARFNQVRFRQNNDDLRKRERIRSQKRYAKKKAAENLAGDKFNKPVST